MPEETRNCMKVTTAFISIGANRHPSVADWCPSTRLLAYGAHNEVALWDPLDAQNRGVTSTLKGHMGKVNAVRWVSVPVYGEEGKDEYLEQEYVLVTGGCDGTIRVWREGGSRGRYRLVKTVEKGEGFDGSVNYIGLLKDARKRYGRNTERRAGLVGVASADGLLTVWSVKGVRRKENGGEERKQVEGQFELQFELLQKIQTKPKYFALTLAISTLPGTEGEGVLLAVAGSGNAIHLYVSCGEGAKEGVHFELKATLMGHESWVRDLGFTYENRAGEEEGGDEGDILLASASQDKYIRLWRIHAGRELPVHGKKSGGEHMTGIVGRSLLSNKAHRFSLRGGEEYSVTFEALLVGHDDWIYTVRWGRDEGTKKLQLLSASADNSVSVWSPDEASGIWLSLTRLGEISDQKGSSTATGSAGGLWTGLWSPDGKTVVALGKTGSWRAWSYDQESDGWVQVSAVGGHTRDVTGVSWGLEGRYLLSTSLDQTTRLYAKWIEAAGGKNSWHEFSRPQIHGYDINCIANVGNSTRFVSGADEKLLRVFGIPKGIAGLLNKLCGIKETSTSTANMPEAADQPVLGLSNKAILDNSTPNEDEEEEPVQDEDFIQTPATSSALLTTLTHPPLEDHLSRHTLWPEIEKLYGHGYEISAAAAAPDGSLIATACRASSIDHAMIRMYETKSWREIKPAIQAHSLTVTRLAFNDDGKYLLSVGRDRQWVVYEREGSPKEGRYKLLASAKGHSRVIWDGKWVPNEVGLLAFATGARDKSVKIWTDAENAVQWKNVATVKFPDAVTALAFAPLVIKDVYIMVVGLEDGSLYVYQARKEDSMQKWGQVGKIDTSITPSKAVTEIQWRPGMNDAEMGSSQFAVSSEDCSVRIYRIEWV